MARQPKKLSKEVAAEEARLLQERKDRDAKLGFKYTPCGSVELGYGCSQAVRWRLPTGVSDTEENVKKYQPKTCGKDECSKQFADLAMSNRRSVPQ